jgi:protein-arginine kinase activator protein McsA
MDIVNEITQMAIEDDEYELASKLRDYNRLLQDYN